MKVLTKGGDIPSGGCVKDAPKKENKTPVPEIIGSQKGKRSVPGDVCAGPTMNKEFGSAAAVK